MLRAILIGPLMVMPAMLLPVFFIMLLETIKASEIPRNAVSEFLVTFRYFGAALVVSYTATLVYGVPIYLLLKKYFHINLATLSVASLVPSVVCGILQNDLVVFLSVGYLSLCVAVTFHLLKASQE